MVWVTQQLCGSSLAAYAAYFYEQAGFAIDDSFNLAVGMYGLAIIGAIISWCLVRSIGRRRLYLCGLYFSLIILLLAGVFGAIPVFTAQPWILGSMIIVLTFVYDLTIGPVCYILVAEIPSTRLRAKTVVLARVAYNIANIITNTITPRMLNPGAWDWKGMSCFFYAGTVVLCLLWCYWRLPEPFGLSYLEIDILFEKRAKASKFREFQARLANTGYLNLSKLEQQAVVWRGY
jgi:SP family general alpha glucoside:H+ symporter-like MFS transporter